MKPHMIHLVIQFYTPLCSNFVLSTLWQCLPQLLTINNNNNNNNNNNRMQWYSRQLVDWSEGNFGLSGSSAYSMTLINHSVFPEKDKLSLIIRAIGSYKELGQRQYHDLQWIFLSCFTDRVEPWLLALEMNPRRPALQASALYQVGQSCRARLWNITCFWL